VVFWRPSLGKFLERIDHSVPLSWTAKAPPYFGYWVNCLVVAMSAHFGIPDSEAFRLDKFSHVRPKSQGLA
jgi:hypothetical protein